MRAKLRAALYRYEVIKMCGRFVQYQGVADYLKVLGTDRLVVSGYDNHPIARYNVAPSTQVNILYTSRTAYGLTLCAGAGVLPANRRV